MKTPRKQPILNWISVYRKPLVLAMGLTACIAYGFYAADVLQSAVLLIWIFMWSLPGCFIALIILIALKKKFLAISIVLVICAFFAGTAIGIVAGRTADEYYDATTGKENLRRGNEIITAVHKYEKDQGNFPGTIEELVPNYLPSVPKTIEGTPYLYGTSKSASNCSVLTLSDGSIRRDCSPGKWRFSIRFHSKRADMCYTFSYDDTSKGFSDGPWGMCDIL